MAWLRTQSIGRLHSVLSTVIVELEALLARAEVEQAQAEVDLSEEDRRERALPTAAWRAFIVHSEGVLCARELSSDAATAVMAVAVLNDAKCLPHFTPRGLLSALELALSNDGWKFLTRSLSPDCQDFLVLDVDSSSVPWNSWDRELRTPFSHFSRYDGSPEDFLRLTELFRDGAGQAYVAATLQQLDDDTWEPDHEAITSSRVLQWMAVHVLDHTRPTREGNVDDAPPEEGACHPAWEPGALTAKQHATLLAVQMHWRRRWYQIEGYGMLLGGASSWRVHDAATLIHKALRIADVFLPNSIWTVWVRLVSEKLCSNDDEYALTAEVAWALADRWLGKRARCAGLLQAALLHLEPRRRQSIVGCADATRREVLRVAAALSVARIFAVDGGEDTGDESSQASDDSYDSCALAEMDWTEESWWVQPTS